MQELVSSLGRVEAPPELWERLKPLAGARGSVALPSRDRKGVVGWLVASVALAVVMLGFFLPRAFHSSDPSEIRAWVRSKAGIEVPLPSKVASGYRLVSARMRDRETAQIAYQVNGGEALLLVSLASAAVAGDGRHRFLSRTATTSSWTMRGLVYTVICPSPEVSQAACQLCHSL